MRFKLFQPGIYRIRIIIMQYNAAVKPILKRNYWKRCFTDTIYIEHWLKYSCITPTVPLSCLYIWHNIYGMQSHFATSRAYIILKSFLCCHIECLKTAFVPVGNVNVVDKTWQPAVYNRTTTLPYDVSNSHDNSMDNSLISFHQYDVDSWPSFISVCLLKFLMTVFFTIITE